VLGCGRCRHPPLPSLGGGDGETVDQATTLLLSLKPAFMSSLLQAGLELVA
jgi:hypothetical protein